MTKAPFPTGNEKRSSRPLELVHSDIMDLGDAHPSLRYVLTLKDDFTNYLWVAPLVRRSDMQAVFTAWHREMKTKLPTKPLATLRTDNGGEYTANAFTEYLSSHGVIHETSLPHTPQQNGVAERVNRTLMDKVRTMTTGASLSSTFWPYALEYATWLHNRISCSSNPSAHSPYYMMTGKPADVSMARTFGCLCYYLPPQGSFGKFEQRGRAGMFLGISNVRKAWIVRDMASDVDTDTRSARFFDDLMLPDADSLLERVLLELEMMQSESDPSLFIWRRAGKDTVWLLTYVDDILIQSNDEEGIQAVIQHLKDNFTLTVNSTMTQFLGLNVTTSRNTISLGLTKYIKQALANYGMEECRSGVRTPISKEPGPQGESPEEVDNQRVMQQVGALLYVSTAGRPDITFATHVLARQASKPTATTVLGIRRVFKYLQNTAEIGLVYGEGDLVLRGYTDSDYANEVGCHSVGGYVFTLGGAAVSWRTKRQTVIATSTTEAEYIAMFEGAREAAHLRRLCADLGFPQREPTVLYVDNQSAIALGKGEQMSQRTKHMEVRYHWTRKAVRDGVVWLEYCPTTKQAADYLTKPVTSKQHLTCSVLSGLQPIPPGVPSGDIRHVKNADVVLTCAASSSGAAPHGVT
ncbi:unnamed protein product [Closterium sp. NIES-65]|nr:unnamed protein product [Closterium sp. NIES-65]CAI5957130.1 unnamed protein product [Closterium sp. NIES-65]CAI5998429.1 unnamed protein product [Closterium sp. NIES-65]